MKKQIIETFFGILLALTVMATIASFMPPMVYAQSGTGPQGKKIYSYSNDVLVLPNMAASPGTAHLPSNAITIDGGNLYVYNATTGLWSKATLATPTPTPTPSSTATATATATSTATPTPTP